MLPAETKKEVLAALAESGCAFTAVPDLCEMSARSDSRLKDLANAGGPLKISACHPRAVHWLFHAAAAPLSESVEVVNLRELSAADATARLMAPELASDAT